MNSPANLPQSSAIHPQPARPGEVRLDEILFATDFSEVSAAALPYAAAVARAFHSMLRIVHVIPPDAYAHIAEQQRAAALATLHREAEERIASLLTASHFRGTRHEVTLDHGEILPALAAEAEKRGADLIVLGLHGRHGLQKMLLGSIAEEILRLAAVPVLAVGPEVTVAPEAEMHVREVLCIADFSPLAGHALRYAEALVRRWNAHLTVLYVVHDIWKDPLSTRMSADAFVRLRLLEKDRMRNLEDLECEFAVEFGPVEDRILEFAEKRASQLIVMDVPSTMHPALAAHMPGPLAYNVASHARCPVLGIRSISEQSPQEKINP